MVTNDGRNSIISVAVIAGFAILISSFIFTFVSNMEKATDEVSTKVDRGVSNVTVSTAYMTDAVINLTGVVNKQLNLAEQERNTSQENLALFMAAFRNQTNEMVNTINDLNQDSNKSREAQTKAFVETLQKSQNLTQYSQNLTEYRNALEENRSSQLDQVIYLLNMTVPLDVRLTNQSLN